jgi:hypothetical protein
MRRRLYYTDKQIVKNLYTTGSEWQTTDGKEYVGPYHTYITGEVFTEPDWNEIKSKPLEKFEVKDQNIINYQMIKDIQVKFETPIPAIIQVTNQERTSGFKTRYIAKKYNETKIIEVDKLQFNKWLENKIDQNVWQMIPVYWKISGPLTTQTKGAVTTLGVREQNTKTVIELESRMPGISMFLNNSIQYYTDNEFVVPKDINAR